MTLFACNPSDDTPSAPETNTPGQSGNDRQTTTSPGDLILYQGNSFVIYYDTNSWNFTRLGKVDGVSSRNEMLDLLGWQRRSYRNPLVSRIKNLYKRI